MKDVSFSWNEMLFSIHKSQLRASKNTNAVFSATKQIKRMQGHGCWKASFSVRESAKCNF